VATTATPRPLAGPRALAGLPGSPQAPAAPPLDVRALAARIAGQDHFGVLGVARDAAAPALKAAYFSLARQVHPDAAPPDESPEDRALRADVFARISEAWSVLSDDARRARYVAELSQGAPVDVARYLEAEGLFTKGTVYVRTRQYPAALDAFVRAIALNAEEPEFRIWRAWVEFLLAPDKRAAHRVSADAIQAALKDSPRCISGYLFLAQMAKLGGDLRGAERHLRLGLALEPGHAELERELKYLRR
jgi:hypothetical protein